jgi:hypothetical protein
VRDSIGQWGEYFFFTRITKLYGRNRPLFRPQFLGDKFPTIDYLVELQNCTGKFVPYFFVQVKTTQQGYTKGANRLKIQVSLSDLQKLASYPAPVYVAGVDAVGEQAYLVCVNGTYTNAVTSLSVRFPIDQHAQDILWHEVKDFWGRHGTFHTKSAFTDPDWS